MGGSQSKLPLRGRTAKVTMHQSMLCDDAQVPTIQNSNTNVNHLYGTGNIHNHSNIVNHIHMPPRAIASPTSYISDMRISATLPPKPTVFHGRSELVDETVRCLIAPGTTQLAILGSGGMGKTTVALAVLHDSRIVEHFRNNRLFISCEALTDADGIVVSLAKLLNIPASNDLLFAVVTYLTDGSRTILVIDNLETVWLTGGAPAPAVDDLLGRLAQIQSLSLIITCRSTDLPQSVDWSNADRAALEPFSLEAALKTLEDRAGCVFFGSDEIIARRLLNAVDRMPLAVSLLGQLFRRGNLLSELLERWNREHTSLLRTHGSGRISNVGVSIGLSVTMLRAADTSQESLQLLALCSMLPDGLRPGVFEKLRPLFQDINRARDTLSAYALAILSSDRVLRALSPVRHFVLEHHPPHPSDLDALYSIFFDIAHQLPVEMDEQYKDLAATVIPEIDNLSSILLTLVRQPSERAVYSIVRFTAFSYWQKPSVHIASTLLPRLEPHSQWTADCLKVIGSSQKRLGDYRFAIKSLTTAARLFLKVDDQCSAAGCKRVAGGTHRLLGEYDRSEMLLSEAQLIYAELEDKLGQARCILDLGRLIRQKQDYTIAAKHFTAARQIFISLGKAFHAAQCSESLGTVYRAQGDFQSAVVELEAAHSAFIAHGNQYHAAQCITYLGSVQRLQRNFILAEQLLGEVKTFYQGCGERLGLASSEWEFGHLRRDQGRHSNAIEHLRSARRRYEDLDMLQMVQDCSHWIELLESTLRSTADDPVSGQQKTHVQVATHTRFG